MSNQSNPTIIKKSSESYLIVPISIPMNSSSEKLSLKLLDLISDMTLSNLNNSQINNNYFANYYQTQVSIRSLSAWAIGFTWIFFRRQRYKKNHSLLKSSIYTLLFFMGFNFLNTFVFILPIQNSFENYLKEIKGYNSEDIKEMNQFLELYKF